MSESSLLTSRYKLLDRPFAAPGKCVTCGASDRPVIDTNWNIDYYGAVYFCTSCLTEVARVIGMVPSVEQADVEADSAQTFNDYAEAHNLKVITNEQYVSWFDLISSLHNVLTGSGYFYDVPDDEKAESPEPPAVEDNGGTAKQKSKSSRDKRSTSVPTSDSDGDFTFNL